MKEEALESSSFNSPTHLVLHSNPTFISAQTAPIFFGREATRNQILNLRNSFHLKDNADSNLKNYFSTNKYKAEVDAIQDLYREARELFDEAIESKNTTYFESDYKDAYEAIKKTLGIVYFFF